MRRASAARRGRVGDGVVDDVEAQPQRAVGTGERDRGRRARTRPVTAAARRTRRPARAPVASGISSGSRWPAGRRRRSTGASARTSSATAASTWRGTPSSQAVCGTPSTSRRSCSAPSGSTTAPALEAEEAQPQPQGRAGAGRRARTRCGWRTGSARGRPRRRRDEDAELPAQRVLLRRRAVGVEQVALEQDGVGDRRRRRRGGRRAVIGPSPASSSAAKVCSQRGQGPRRAPGAERGERVLGEPEPRHPGLVGVHHVASTPRPGAGTSASELPRDEPDLHAGDGRLVEDGAAEQQAQRGVCPRRSTPRK